MLRKNKLSLAINRLSYNMLRRNRLKRTKKSPIIIMEMIKLKKKIPKLK